MEPQTFTLPTTVFGVNPIGGAKRVVKGAVAVKKRIDEIKKLPLVKKVIILIESSELIFEGKLPGLVGIIQGQQDRILDAIEVITGVRPPRFLPTRDQVRGLFRRINLFGLHVEVGEDAAIVVTMDPHWLTDP